MTKNISREALYELVWSKPMTHVAKELGISDVMLGKMCKEQLVPKPPRGYWANLGSAEAYRTSRRAGRRTDDSRRSHAAQPQPACGQQDAPGSRGSVWRATLRAIDGWCPADPDRHCRSSPGAPHQARGRRLRRGNRRIA